MPRFSPPGGLNPRDEGTDVGQGARTLRRRIIRRGVTYGPSYEKDPDAERGLLFICYQASITDQFVQDDKRAKVDIPERFVVSTGGAYLFAPSISAIREVLAAE